MLQDYSVISIAKKEINELNYAKFMAADEVDDSNPEFRKRKSLKQS